MERPVPGATRPHALQTLVTPLVPVTEPVGSLLVDTIDNKRHDNPFAEPGTRWEPRGPAKLGGLHQLAVWSGEVVPGGLPAAFEHRPGFNNRGFYEGVVKDLNALLGTRYMTAYKGGGVQVTDGRIQLDEKALDALIGHGETPEAKRAMATFVIAHEVMHLYLKHLDTVDGKRPKELTLKLHDKYRKVFELQADYLAAKYLHLRGLDTAVPESFFLTDAERDVHGSLYPPGWLRAAAIASAKTPGIRQDLFQNDVLDALELLETLIGPKP